MSKSLFVFLSLFISMPHAFAEDSSEASVEVEEIISDGDAAKEVARDRAKDLERERRETRDLEHQAERARAQADERKRIAGPKIVATDAEIKSILKAKAKAAKDLDKANRDLEKLDQQLKVQKEALEKARDEHDHVAGELKDRLEKAEDYKKDAREAARETGRLNAENKQLARDVVRAQAQMNNLKSQYLKAKGRRDKASALNENRKKSLSDTADNVEWAQKQVGPAPVPMKAPSRPSYRTSSSDEGMY